MYNIIKSRILQGCRTLPFPAPPESMPDRFRGLPEIAVQPCLKGCNQCQVVCPTAAIYPRSLGAGIQMDLGRCIFCGECVGVCPVKKIKFLQDYQLSCRTREGLQVSKDQRPVMEPLTGEKYKLFHRSLKLRQVSTGGCNGCEVDVNVLNTLAFDLGRFGIQMVASPRHADGLLITGPVTQNMYKALLKTYEAVPSPKIVIVTGSCAISGGLFRDMPDVKNGVGNILPIDLYIPGCPPHPWTILDGLVRLIHRC
jgi:Ni,Fe-hydrogenase III small subunit/Pyruvate/2-oxoacid:ferredoxin oxidoreductase delta subunit